MTVFLAKAARREMTFNGPLRSGLVIDSRALLARGYADYQHDFAAAISAAYAGHWYTPAQGARGNKMKIDADTRRGNTIIPGYFIGRTLTGADLESALGTLVLPSVIKLDGTCLFHIHSIDIRVYDMGYGSATFEGEIEALRDMSLDEFRVAAEKASSELTAFKTLYLETFKRVGAQLAPELTLANFHGSGKNAYWANTCLFQGIGDLFWVHRVFHVACASGGEYAVLKETGKALIFGEQPALIEDASVSAGLSVYPGNGNSAEIYDASAVQPKQLGTLLSMVRTQNIFYVAAEDIDRDLFFLSNDLDRQKHSQDMRLLERQSELIVEYQSKVTLFKAVYDDFDNSLDPQGLKVWHALEKAWHTRDRFANLNTKLELVEKIYNRIRENLNHLQNKKLGLFMLAFTLISSLSVIVDTVDFTTQGDNLAAPSPLRVGVLVATLVIVILFAMGLIRPGKRKV
ncbi:MAG TPA: hypothetical protein VEF76_08825 [Patescibacteria group bacterium]|nr:hypothetical protein [Patescibacteria group bacterium]